MAQFPELVKCFDFALRFAELGGRGGSWVRDPAGSVDDNGTPAYHNGR
jgi:hypothetical protein